MALERNSTNITEHGDVDVTTSAVFKNNWTAIVAPAITDDSSAGYTAGSEWIDLLADVAYKCLDASAGAAIWRDTAAALQGLSSVLGVSNTTADGQTIEALNGGGQLDLRNGLDNVVMLSNDGGTFVNSGLWMDSVYNSLYVKSWGSAVTVEETSPLNYLATLFTDEITISIFDDPGAGVHSRSGIYITDTTVSGFITPSSGTPVSASISSRGAQIAAGTIDAVAVGGTLQKVKTDSATYVNKLAFNTGEAFETLLDYTIATQENTITVPNKSGTIVLDTDAKGLYSQTVDSATVTNTLVETAIVGSGVGTLSVGANIFKVGDSFHAKIGGLISCQAPDTIIINVRSDGSLLASTGVITLSAATAKGWEIELDFVIAVVGATGTIKTNGNFNYNRDAGSLEGFVFQDSQPINTTISNTLNVTVTWGQAKAADQINSINYILHKNY